MAKVTVVASSLDALPQVEQHLIEDPNPAIRSYLAG